MLDRLEEHIRFYRTAMNVRTARQEFLASNIANADTPHFKARDLDFKSVLSNALGHPGGPMIGPVELSRTHPGHLAGQREDRFSHAVKYRAEYQGAVDGNTVNMDIERAAFAENSLNIDALITFINRRFSGLEAAIRGQ